MVARAFLHLGTPKSGTSFLQQVWWANKEALKERGLLVAGDDVADHFAIAAYAREHAEMIADLDEHQRDAWQRVLAEMQEWEGDALVTSEHFAFATEAGARRMVEDLTAIGAEVHLLVTVRDLARVLPSEWQQKVKQGSRQSYPEFLASLQPDQPRLPWGQHDVVAVLDRWAVDVPPERVHLVVVPLPDAPKAELWIRTNRVFGLDVADLPSDAPRPNESLGLAETEMIRRVSLQTPEETRDIRLNRVMKTYFSLEVLAPTSSKEKITLPAEQVALLDSYTTRLVATVTERGYDVVGDLEDLRPVAGPTGRMPADVTDAELLDAATMALSTMLVDRRDKRLEAAQRAAARAAEAARRAAEEAAAPPPPPPTFMERVRGRIIRALS